MLNVKKINVSDFSKANTADMQKLARSLNPFFDSVQQVLNKGLTVGEHLPFEYLYFDVTVDGTGTPLANLKLPISLSNVKGMLIIKAEASGSFPTANPFISFTIDKNIATINKVLGIPANVNFKMTVMVLS
jgi:hypothetical protein